MAAVMLPSIGGIAASWPQENSARLGPFQDDSGNLWIIAVSVSGTKLRAYKSSDGGASWDTCYESASTGGIYAVDAVFDLANGVIYVVNVVGAAAIRIYSFTIGTTTWVQFSSATGQPTAFAGINGYYPAFLIRRSTGEFVVVYQGPLHRSMGGDYRSVYYARCSAAGAWSAGVEVDAGGKVHFDCKGACLGASDRVHMIYVSGTNLYHRSLSSANALDTAGIPAGGSSANFYTIYYDGVLAKIVVDSSGIYPNRVARADSIADPSWTGDTNNFGDSERASCPGVFIYEQTDAKLYAFYRDGTSDDVFVSATGGTAWEGTGAQNVVSGFGYSIQGDGGTNERAGQSFTKNVAETISRVALYLWAVGTPTDDLIVEIRSGSFSGTVLGSGTFTPVSGVWNMISISPTELASGTTYYLTVRRSGSRSTANYWSVRHGNSDLYANGAPAYSSNGTWTPANNDLAFTIGGAPTTLDACTAVTGISVGLIDELASPLPDSGTYFGQPPNGYECVDQSFTLPRSCTLQKVLVSLAKGGSPTDNLVIEVQTDDGSGKPSGTVVGTVATITGSSLPAEPPPYQDQIYECSVSLTGGTRYHLVFRRTGSLNNTNSYIANYITGGGWLPNETYAHLISGTWNPGTLADLRLALLTSTSAIGVVFNDSGIYFDKFVLASQEAPPEPIEPVTTNEEFFALL